MLLTCLLTDCMAQCEGKVPCDGCEPCGIYIGNVGNNHIRMTLVLNYPLHQGYIENQMHTISGCYYYAKVGSPLILRTNHYIEGYKTYTIEEFYNGKKTGYFVFPQFSCGQKFISGTWYSPDGTRKYPVSLTLDKADFDPYE
ncbi:MAG: hypothetical protein RML94_16395 [Bacteroidia bacterium]|nr:hypothetical protein [Bacteroidia bacterium]